MNSKHPLDRDDPDDEGTFDFSSPQSGQIVRPEQRILRRSIWAIATFGVFVVFSSVAMNNTTYGSSEYQVARAINIVMAVLLLLSFVGILVAYQWENIKNMVNQMGSANSSSNTLVGSFRVSRSPIGLLTILSLAMIAFAWAIAILVTTTSVSTIVLTTVSGVLPGLMIAMIVWNRGCVRAYAIGVLASLAINTFGSYQPLMLLMQMGMGYNPGVNYPGVGGGTNSSLAWMIGIQWTIVALAGLVPAWYVWLIGSMEQKKQEAKSGSSQFDWKPSKESDE